MTDVQLIHGDCLEVLPTLDVGSVDAIVTDPPYGTEVARDGYGRRAYLDDSRFIAGDTDLSVVAGILAEAPRLLRPDSWVAVFCSPKRRFDVETLCREAGLPVGGEIVWDKGRGTALGGGLRCQHETVLLCRHGKPAGRSSLFSVMEAIHGFNGKPRHHVHEKPVRPMRSLVEYCCPRGGVVLDPCTGSGSTLVACLKSERKAIGIDVDAGCVSVARRRLADAATPLFAEARP
jgi:site-specific DNA-methyltransferase (adenine-specific)